LCRQKAGNGTSEQAARGWLSSGSGSCQLQITQTFTVDGYPVLIMSKDRNQTGRKNIITINLNGNQASCPTVTITP
jgi:hypothetical protein